MNQPGNTAQINLSSLKLDNLPRVLNFDDSKNPLLSQTAERIIKTAQKSLARAEAVAATYEKLAEENLDDQLDESRQNAPPDYYAKQITKARGGLLINLARIWRDAGMVEKCRQALDRAIAFARANRWASVVTALENERQKLQPNH